MPAIVIDGDPSQGHCWLSTPAKASNNSSVKIGGTPVVILGDSYIPHIPSCTSPTPTTHAVATSEGSPSVFIGGVPVIRDGDPLDCGDVADTVQLSVFADGGGNALQIAPGAAGAVSGEEIGYFVKRIRDSYSQLTIKGRYKNVYNLSTSSTSKVFEHWCPGATLAHNRAHESEGFVLTLEEELTGNEYPSFRGIGAPSIPAVASPIFRDPFDDQVNYSSAPSVFGTVDPGDGSFTFNTGFVPPLNSSSWTGYKSIPVLVSYEDPISLVGGGQFAVMEAEAAAQAACAAAEEAAAFAASLAPNLNLECGWGQWACIAARNRAHVAANRAVAKAAACTTATVLAETTAANPPPYLQGARDPLIKKLIHIPLRFVVTLTNCP